MAKSTSAGSVFRELRERHIEYLEAQYHVRDDALLHERRAMLEREGVAWQVPYLEGRRLSHRGMATPI